MRKNKKVCTKKKLTKNEAYIHLNGIIKSSGKTPWRDEISTYECDICGKNVYHLSSLVSDMTLKTIKGKSYFEIQKEKWGVFLQKFSKNRGNIIKRNKKYST